MWCERVNTDTQREIGRGQGREREGERDRERRVERERQRERERGGGGTYCCTSCLYFFTSLTYSNLADGVSLLYLSSAVEQASM